MTINTWTLIWVTLPFVSGFTIYLFPKIDRYLAIITLSLTTIYPCWLLLTDTKVSITFRDSFGVNLLIDSLSGYLILTNCFVTTAVTLYCWQKQKKAFFYTILMVLYGSVSACFIGNDLISFYVALEVISIASFLLIVYPRSNFSIWIGLRYLLISNTAMLFYLVGTILEYQAHHSFEFEGLQESPPEAIALIVVALLVKGGIFVSGLWLPLTHSSVDTPVSAMLSGIVIKTGIYPLIRLSLLIDQLDMVITILAATTAIFGVTYAIFEKDIKRMFALSTISQLGFILATPATAGIYAFSHGIVKSSLFLMSGALPTRDLKKLQQTKIANSLWICLVIASLSNIGIPFFAGFVTKTLALKGLVLWKSIVMNIAAIGTAICFARFIFQPHSSTEKTTQDNGFWLAIILLLTAIILGNFIDLSTYNIPNITKALAKMVVGIIIYLVFVKKAMINLPRNLEKIDNLIGVMILTLVGLFWLV